MFYSTGKLCNRGHDSVRYASTGLCVECSRETRDALKGPKQSAYKAQYYQKTKEHHQRLGRVWVEENREKSRQIKSDWAAANPEKVRAAANKFAREDYKNNRAKRCAKSREWARANPDLVRAMLARWKAENPEKDREYHMNRRARKKSGGGRVTAKDIVAVVARQKGRCAACGCRDKLEMDHIMPLALGGSNEKTNIQGLCRPCNMSKHAKHPIDFNRSLGRLL